MSLCFWLVRRLGERLTYIMALTTTRLFVFTTVLAWLTCDWVAVAGWTSAAVSWALLCRVVWHWGPRAMHEVRLATGLRILQGLSASAGGGIAGYQRWLREVAADLEMQVVFEPAPDGTDGAVAVFRPTPKGAVIGVYRR